MGDDKAAADKAAADQAAADQAAADQAADKAADQAAADQAAADQAADQAAEAERVAKYDQAVAEAESAAKSNAEYDPCDMLDMDEKAKQACRDELKAADVKKAAEDKAAQGFADGTTASPAEEPWEPPAS